MGIGEAKETPLPCSSLTWEEESLAPSASVQTAKPGLAEIECIRWLLQDRDSPSEGLAFIELSLCARDSVHACPV